MVENLVSQNRGTGRASGKEKPANDVTVGISEFSSPKETRSEE